MWSEWGHLSTFSGGQTITTDGQQWWHANGGGGGGEGKVVRPRVWSGREKHRVETWRTWMECLVSWLSWAPASMSARIPDVRREQWWQWRRVFGLESHDTMLRNGRVCAYRYLVPQTSHLGWGVSRRRVAGHVEVVVAAGREGATSDTVSTRKLTLYSYIGFGYSFRMAPGLLRFTTNIE